MKFIIAFVTFLFTVAFAAEKKSNACLDCTASCVILPPANQTFPCYEGTPSDGNFCFDTVYHDYF
jgi:hypothetical protein